MNVTAHFDHVSVLAVDGQGSQVVRFLRDVFSYEEQEDRRKVTPKFTAYFVKRRDENVVIQITEIPGVGVVDVDGFHISLAVANVSTAVEAVEQWAKQNNVKFRKELAGTNKMFVWLDGILNCPIELIQAC